MTRVRGHYRAGRPVRGYQQTRSRAATLADVGTGALVAAGTAVSLAFDLASLAINITGLLLSALFGLRWAYRSRHAIRWRRIKGVFKPKTRARTTPRRKPKGGHPSAPWAGNPAPWSGPRSGEFHIAEDGRVTPIRR